jgi:hypothetical protein
MDLIGTPASPDMVGYSLGYQDASPPDLCTDADLGNLPFGKLIGDGSQAAAFEFLCLRLECVAARSGFRSALRGRESIPWYTQGPTRSEPRYALVERCGLLDGGRIHLSEIVQ